jgi:hypothetical protein
VGWGLDVTDALHCRDCDSTDCAGFQQRYTPEPIPALRPERVANAATRRAALAEIERQLTDVRRRLQEKP